MRDTDALNFHGGYYSRYTEPKGYKARSTRARCVRLSYADDGNLPILCLGNLCCRSYAGGEYVRNALKLQPGRHSGRL